MPQDPSLKLQTKKWFQRRDSLVQSTTGTLDLELPKKMQWISTPLWLLLIKVSWCTWVLISRLFFFLICRKMSILSHAKMYWKPLWNKWLPHSWYWQRDSLSVSLWPHPQNRRKPLQQIHGHLLPTWKCWLVQPALRLGAENRESNCQTVQVRFCRQNTVCRYVVKLSVSIFSFFF